MFMEGSPFRGQWKSAKRVTRGYGDCKVLGVAASGGRHGVPQYPAGVGAKHRGVKDMFFICFEKTYNGGGKRICFLLC